MTEDLVSVIIVNWNGGEVLEKCLKSLQKISYSNWELIVVDNGSSDNSLDLLSKYRLGNGEIKIVRNKTNLGFAPANNQGYKQSKGSFILLLNNDTEVDPKFLSALVEILRENTEFGIVQPKIFLMDKPEYLDNCGSFFTRTGFLEHWGFFKKNSRKFDKKRIVFSVKGACMLIKREVIEKVGLFDEDYFSYFEETDFCWRAALCGYKSVYMPGAKIYHKVGFSSKKQSQLMINYHSIKNRFASLIKNLEIKNLIVIGGLHLIIMAGLAIYYLLKLQIAKSIMIWKGIIWNITNLFRTLKKRRKIQKMRTIKDELIFEETLHKINWKEMFIHFTKVEANFK